MKTTSFSCDECRGYIPMGEVTYVKREYLCQRCFKKIKQRKKEIPRKVSWLDNIYFKKFWRKRWRK